MSKAILVVGDAGIDQYIHAGNPHYKESSPCPVFAVDNYSYMPGCAANVAMGCAALDHPTYFVTVLSGRETDEGTNLLRSYEEQEANFKLRALRLDYFRVPIKMRLMDKDHRQYVRMDLQGGPISVGDRISLEISRKAKELLLDSQLDIGCVVLSDYSRDVFLNPYTAVAIIGAARRHQVPVIVSTRRIPLDLCAGCDMVVMNHYEATTLTGGTSAVKAAEGAFSSINKYAEYGAVLITAGADGMYLKEPCIPDVTHIPAYPPKQVIDTIGAGDTALALLASQFADRVPSLALMARRASAAAGVTCGHWGTMVVRPEEIQEALERHGLRARTKHEESWVDVVRAVRNAKMDHKRVVFVNGCFDMLHNGHIRFLKEARTYGDFLVVGVNSDESVQRLKGCKRPARNAAHRVEMLTALECVDLVTTFAADTPDGLITAVEPNVLVKGAEYRDTNIPGASFVKRIGGSVVFVPRYGDYSTTNQLSLQECTVE
jgi:D-beta-D-heptose 7-phosphate kinase / D-beta-D-heptose 1-phosphate adenosyltransferase